jgi:hypothetical protein
MGISSISMKYVVINYAPKIDKFEYLGVEMFMSNHNLGKVAV